MTTNLTPCACFRAEKLQFWKQFTTKQPKPNERLHLFSRWKITILKAIHNAPKPPSRPSVPVFALKNYNFESNSQQKGIINAAEPTCFRAEKLQFWKQFTTEGRLYNGFKTLFSRWKITILKAIHNNPETGERLSKPVFALKNYNFESNSQHFAHYNEMMTTCFRAEKLQFWKQFTTQIKRLWAGKHLFSRWKITILKAIHNTNVVSIFDASPVFALKNYNFESNSQP